jgi:hypothetical protein
MNRIDDHSPSLTPAATPREGFTDLGDFTQEDTAGAPTPPLDPDQEFETLVAAEEWFELLRNPTLTSTTEASGEQDCALPSTQTQQAGPSTVGVSQFPQHSVRPRSPEPSKSNPVPTATPSRTWELPSPPLTPSRNARPFKASAHSQGETIWKATASLEDLAEPPAPVAEDEPGTLYIHRNNSDDALQLWLLGNNKEWTPVQNGPKVQHPTLKDRYLVIRLDGSPNWVTLSSWYSAKKRANI